MSRLKNFITNVSLLYGAVAFLHMVFSLGSEYGRYLVEKELQNNKE